MVRNDSTQVIRWLILAAVSMAVLLVLVGCCRYAMHEPGLITFETDRDLNWKIYAMNPNGTGQVNLTNDPACDGEAHGNRYGARIVFSSDRDGDGSNPVQLTFNGAYYGDPQ